MAWILPFVLLGSCDKELVEYEKGSVEIVVERGDAWLHDFPLFLGIKRKNPPQIAVWIEDAQSVCPAVRILLRILPNFMLKM